MRRTMKVLVWGVVLACAAGTGMPAAAQAQAQLWLISTRQAPSCDRVPSEALGYWRLDEQCAWAPSDLAAFLAGDNPAVPTTIFVHGNDNDTDRAVDVATQLYQALVSDAHGRPFRLVLWSWPSDKVVRRIRQDVRIKACRSDEESFYLSAVLDRMHPAVPVALIGYSFGGRVVGGALELLAGGAIDGQCLPRQASPSARAPMRSVLIAAGMDADWFCTGHRNGLALNLVEHMLITADAADPAMKHYGLMYHIHGPAGMGYQGPTCLGEHQGKVDALDITCEVGRHHRWEYYFSSGSLRCRLPWYTFLEEPTATPAPAAATLPAKSHTG